MDFSGGTDLSEFLESRSNTASFQGRSLRGSGIYTVKLPSVPNRYELSDDNCDEDFGLTISYLRPETRQTQRNPTKNQKVYSITNKHPIVQYANSPNQNDYSLILRNSTISPQKFERYSNFKRTFNNSQPGKYHRKCLTTSLEIGENITEEKLNEKLHKNIKYIKRVLIPQTKAYEGYKSLTPVAGLKVKGVIKRFALRKSLKV